MDEAVGRLGPDDVTFPISLLGSGAGD
jgi:hypothetical protein